MSSDGCALPKPYCHDGLHVCVECLADRNCPFTGACDVERGVCVACASDTDCAVPNPYCDTELDRCVECRTDQNCAGGVLCRDGLCGSCGDGVCGSRERYRIDGVFFRDGPPGLPGLPEEEPAGPVLCAEDCAPLWNPRDLKSAVGEAVATVDASELHNLYVSPCGGFEGADVAFTWKAPKSGTYFFQETTSYYSLVTVITDGEAYCGGGGIDVEIGAGEEITIVIDTDLLDQEQYVLNILDVGVGCQGPGCEPSPDGGTNPEEEQACLDAATARGDAMCSGVQCACAHCPQDYDDCAIVPGCDAVSACMTETGCVGADCYNSGACRRAIDSQGGLSGPAFRAAAGLQSCALSYDCALPCGDGGGPDAGQLCEPGRAVACECDGGTGTKECAADGQSFGACECSGGDAGVDTADDDDGCGCRVAGGRTQGGAFGLVVAALSLGVARRSASRARWRRRTR